MPRNKMLLIAGRNKDKERKGRWIGVERKGSANESKKKDCVTHNQISCLPLSTRFSSATASSRCSTSSQAVLRSRKRHHLRQLAALLLLVFRPVSLEIVRESGRASKSWPRYESGHPLSPNEECRRDYPDHLKLYCRSRCENKSTGHSWQ